MTDLLEQAFAQASKLSPQEQDALAEWLLKELEAEDRWGKTFAASQDTLSKLGAEALAEYRQTNPSRLSLTDFDIQCTLSVPTVFGQEVFMRSFTAVIERCPDTGLYVGYVPGFPGAHSQASSMDELKENLV